MTRRHVNSRAYHKEITRTRQKPLARAFGRQASCTRVASATRKGTIPYIAKPVNLVFRFFVLVAKPSFRLFFLVFKEGGPTGQVYRFFFGL